MLHFPEEKLSVTVIGLDPFLLNEKPALNEKIICQKHGKCLSRDTAMLSRLCKRTIYTFLLLVEMFKKNLREL